MKLPHGTPQEVASAYREAIEALGPHEDETPLETAKRVKEKAWKWDNARLDERIVYMAHRTNAQFWQFVADAALGQQLREEAAKVGADPQHIIRGTCKILKDVAP